MAAREVLLGSVGGVFRQGCNGLPLLLLHGFTGSPEAWGLVVDRLGAGRTILAPWLPGHGRAGWPDSLATFNAVVDALAEAAGTLKPGPWVVAGYSLGGRLALRFAVRHPGLVGRLVVIAGRPGLSTPAERAARVSSDGRLASLLREQGLAAFVAAWEALPLFSSQSRLGAEARATQRAVRLGHTAEGLARALEVLGAGVMPDCRADIPWLPMTVDLVVGALDVSYRAVTAEMAAAIPGARVTLAPGCGHNVVLESPETVAEVLAARPGEEGA